MAVVTHKNEFIKLKYTDYDAAEYSEDESAKEQYRDESGIDLGGDGELRGSSSTSAVRKEVDESTACDKEGISPDDNKVNQSNSADGITPAKNGSHDTVDASRDSVASADNPTDGKVQIARSCMKLCLRTRLKNSTFNIN